MNEGRCTFCGKPINADRDYREVTGFERHRAQGGTNAVRLRKPSNKWACADCVGKQARGIAVEQQSLI